MSTVILVGAGFSFDANRYLLDADARYAKRYPLVPDLAHACFPGADPEALEIEQAFLQAQLGKDRKPVETLVEIIQSADHYIGDRVARLDTSSFDSLVTGFSRPSFLSFNYDCLLELVLFQRGLWHPNDGFGVACEAEIDDSYQHVSAKPNHSASQVLHLHGSVYLFPLEFEVYREDRTPFPLIRERAEVRFRFDPDALSGSFIPFRGGYSGLTYKHTDARIIAPVPDKSEALANRFIQDTYSRAVELIRKADGFVAIGYNFSECDRSSFEPLTRAMATSGKSLLVVGPNAVAVATRVRLLHPLLSVTTFQGTFQRWALEGFPS